MTEKIIKGVAVDKKVAVPKLKGKTKIELFENGKKIKEYIDENMMTNMLSNIFNPKRIFVDGEYGYSLWANHLPFYNTILGGLLLYENPITENADLKLAPIDNACVGHAGSAYSGTVATRGSFNENESGFINTEDESEGYRFVWDFGTDKANGTISCACLTSLWGGNCGFGKGITYQTNESNDYFLSKTIDLNSIERCVGVRIKYDGTTESLTERTFRYLGVVNDMAVLAYIKAKNKLCILKVPPNNFDFNFWDTQSDDSLILKETQYDLPFTLGSRWSVFVKDKMLYIVSHTSATTFNFCVFDPQSETLGETQSRTVSPNYYNTNYNTLVCSDDYWVTFNGASDIIRYPEQGGAGETFATLSTIPDSANVKNGIFYAIDGGEYSYAGTPTARAYILDIEHPAENVFSRICGTGYYGRDAYHAESQIDPDDESIIVGFGANMSALSADSRFTICTKKMTGYLATINNLQSPITKTAGQTMKITYEITPDETQEVSE